jgi:hypothetical protein
MTLLLLVAALAQPAPRPAAAVSPAAVSAPVEERDLDIAYKQIVEESYRASRALRLLSNDGSGIALDAGVALAARRIHVTLRNVKGHVRFRFNFAALNQRLHALPDAGEGSPSTPSP